MTASINDEVYFHHQGQPKSGKVIAHGKHGCTVDSGDPAKPHKLKWEHLAGFKKRAPQRYTVEEEGEDGLIVKNEHGHRRLVTIPAEARQEHLQLEERTKKPR